MPLIKDNQLVDGDWRALEDNTEIPGDGDVIVSFARLLADFGKLSQRDGRLGVRLSGEQRPQVLEAFLPGLDLIAISPSHTTEDHGCSQVRALRDLGFTGELRAVGQVSPDNLAAMLEAGFDTFEADQPYPSGLWHQALADARRSYQPGYHPTRLHNWRLRWARGEEI